MKIVSPPSADWSKTRLTYSAQREALNACVASTLDAVRIVLLRPEQGSEKYVLGPVIVDGTDVERATARLEQQPDLWSVSIGPQNEIAIILDAASCPRR